MRLDRVNPGRSVPDDANVVIEIPMNADPGDVLVISPYSLITGVAVRCRSVGMLRMDDEAIKDAKLLAVPIDRVTSQCRGIRSPRDLPPARLNASTHFFQHYKDPEPGKWVKVKGWTGAPAARREILSGVKRDNAARKKPAF